MGVGQLGSTKSKTLKRAGGQSSGNLRDSYLKIKKKKKNIVQHIYKITNASFLHLSNTCMSCIAI